MNEPGKTENKHWMKPEMIVLVRNNPEETVLVFCKGNGALSFMTSNEDCETSTVTFCDGTCDALSVS